MPQFKFLSSPFFSPIDQFVWKLLKPAQVFLSPDIHHSGTGVNNNNIKTH